jgi:class 3 adenylate cyclase/CHASE2 domain-containing sensor protein
MHRPARKVVLALASALAAGLLAAEAVHRGGFADRAETAYGDLWHRLAGKRFEATHVALVQIDEPTLAENADTPLAFWTPLFARAAGRLREAGARTVAFDFLFTSSAESWIRGLPLKDESAAERYGLPFRQAIGSGGVLLAASRLGRVEGVDEFLLPAPEYLLAVPDLDIAAHVGLVDLPSDEDGGVRRYQVAPALRLPEGVGPREAPRLSFPALVAARAGAGALAETPELRPITYAGPPGTVPAIALRELLAPGPLTARVAGILRGKAVIVGANFPGMNDVHVTPYTSSFFGRAGAFMTGAEVQANIAETLLSGRATEPLSAPARGASFAVLIAAAALAFQLLSPWRGLLALLAAGLAAAGTGYAWFGAFRVFPAAALQAGLVAAYVASYGLRLTREERERARIGSMFSRYLSPEVVAELVASPRLPELGGRTEQVTVLFSDIRGFTTYSEKLSAREVVEMLNAYLDRACAAVLAEGGSIDKFIGDAIMAEFGAPVPHADHARRALRAALALQRAAEAFRPWMAQRFAGRGLHEFRVGVGVHTGDAVIGNIGSQARMEFTAIGDTVNTASRLESATKTVGCGILASAATVAAAGPGVRTGKSDLIQVKGRAQPVAIHEVIAVEDAST